MTTSLFDLYKIGVGPSSSHTMGPMRAACRFAQELKRDGLLDGTARAQTDLYGSLALTGKGHATDRAVLLGLQGNEPAKVDPAAIESTVAMVRASRRIDLAGKRAIFFDETHDLLFHRDQMFPPGASTKHPNGMRFTAFDADGAILAQRTFFSIGGGFITEDGEADQPLREPQVRLPFPFHSAAELLEISRAHSLSIDRVMLANECERLRALDPSASPNVSQESLELRVEAHVRAGIEQIWQTMQACVERGMAAEGILPGGLQVRRRARRLAERLRARDASGKQGDPLAPLDWLTVYAMAVNEENAAGGRVVTAPTNGAAGVVPAVGLFYQRFVEGSSREGIMRFFLASAAIGVLYKENASISGAEVGCQGEVGVACSMAAAGLTSALGGNDGQIEHAAEIAMEHNLGMTCDPIGGLVQIPCIERNAMGAAKAVQAARLAMNEPEAHKVSLDQVIRTMYLTGLDMQSRYKETSLAGLALNVIEC
ncbi:MAG: L-serine ammonia-lyase [Terracidiphilus sp.]|nr:L-serine ammonia-lyase [Terracidiphilus sp.]MDR3799369.1 L-serine ammonia-lyase [Terracidiphilus sp.]